MTIAADSSQQGYLQGSPASLYGDPLEDLFGRVIQGITGLPGNLVRPKYQVNPGTIPEFDVDWASFSVYVEPVLWNAYKTLEDDLTYTVEGTEVLRVLVSFFGPGYQNLERTWRDGIQLGQNRDELANAKIAFIEFADPVITPLLLKERWVKHIDVRGTFHRWARRDYKVRSLVYADGVIHGDKTPESEVLGTFQTDPPPT
jgi:hypothetical protein